jgi:hypothetical protein
MLRAMKLGMLSVVVLAAMAGKTRADQIFDFSFTNTLGNVAGTITGEVILPSGPNYTGPATGVLITSIPPALNVILADPNDATTWSGQYYNTFVETAGAITSVNFDAFDLSPYPAQLFLRYGLVAYPDDSTVLFANYGELYVQGPPTFVAQSSSTPEPATITLLASAFAVGGLGLCRRRRATTAS